MKMDAELELWRTQWRAEIVSPVFDDLRKRVNRQSRFMRLMLAADVLVTLVIGGGAIVWTALDPRVETALLLAAVWVFIGAAWIFALRNRKGSWTPASSSTTAFLDVSIRRARGSLRAVRFGAVLYVCEIVFSMSWVYHDVARTSPMTIAQFIALPTSLAVWGVTVAFAAFLVWYRTKKRTELAYLLGLQTELAGE